MHHFQSDPDLEAKAALLADHFSYPDILTGTDILTGRHLHALNPEDSPSFFRAHILGPGRTRYGASVVVRHVDGGEEKVESFYRPQVRPFDREGMTSTISISIGGQPGLDPTLGIKGIIDTLRTIGYAPVVERSFRLCHWVLWLFLDEPFAQRPIEHEAYRLYAMIRDRQLVAPENLVVPAIEMAKNEVYLPYQFFAGSFFGQLYHLQQGTLYPLDLAAVPHNSLGSGVSSLRDYKSASIRPHLEALVNEWWKTFGPRRVRASRLLRTMQSNIEMAFNLQNELSHAQAVELGGCLSDLNGRDIGGKIVRSRPSGHSTVYWLVEATSS